MRLATTKKSLLFFASQVVIYYFCFTKTARNEQRAEKASPFWIKAHCLHPSHPSQERFTRFAPNSPFSMLSIICALAENRAIGNRGNLLYHLSADLRRFKALTTGHTVLMGRKTFESLPKGALPNRRNIVISRQEDYSAPGIEVFTSFEAAIAATETNEEVFVIGGESVYSAALPSADRLYLTFIHATPDEADTFFPIYNKESWREVGRESHQADERNPESYDFVDFERRKEL